MVWKMNFDAAGYSEVVKKQKMANAPVQVKLLIVQVSSDSVHWKLVKPFY